MSRRIIPLATAVLLALWAVLGAVPGSADPYYEVVLVDSADPDGSSTLGSLQEGQTYTFKASGTYVYWAAEGAQADAECSTGPGGDTTWEPDRYPISGEDLLDLYVNGAAVNWVAETPDANGCDSVGHVYTYEFTPSVTGPVAFAVFDLAGNYDDNSGVLTVEVSQPFEPPPTPTIEPPDPTLPPLPDPTPAPTADPTPTPTADPTPTLGPTPELPLDPSTLTDPGPLPGVDPSPPPSPSTPPSPPAPNPDPDPQPQPRNPVGDDGDDEDQPLPATGGSGGGTTGSSNRPNGYTGTKADGTPLTYEDLARKPVVGADDVQVLASQPTTRAPRAQPSLPVHGETGRSLPLKPTALAVVALGLVAALVGGRRHLRAVVPGRRSKAWESDGEQPLDDFWNQMDR